MRYSTDQVCGDLILISTTVFCCWIWHVAMDTLESFIFPSNFQFFQVLPGSLGVCRYFYQKIEGEIDQCFNWRMRENCGILMDNNFSAVFEKNNGKT